MHFETRAIHAGRSIDPATGAVTPPIHLSTTFERAADGEYPTGFSYSREKNPNRSALQECLASLEGGEEALCFASGLAVVTAVMQGLEPGDHILAPSDVYYGLKQVAGKLFAKWPLNATFVDMTDLDAVRAAVTPATRLMWIETPSNPLLRIVDLAALADIGRRANAISICDSTFATPVLMRPLEFGVDMVMHSTTKYIGGHSDVVGGALVRKHQNYLFERVRTAQEFGGAVPSPFDCWLTLRGLSTLAYRMRGHSSNAQAVAEFLAGDDRVEAVHYPGLASHAGHELAARQMSGYGGMLSFQVRGGKSDAMQAASKVKLFTRATSLGGPHSLIEHRASIEGSWGTTPQNLLRVSVGLEHPADLIADLAQALQL